MLSPNLSAGLLDELRKAPEPGRRVALVARLTRRVYESMATEFDLLHGAGVITPELSQAARQVGARRRDNQRRLVSFLIQQRRLRSRLGPEEALDVL